MLGVIWNLKLICFSILATAKVRASLLEDIMSSSRILYRSVELSKRNKKMKTIWSFECWHYPIHLFEKTAFKVFPKLALQPWDTSGIHNYRCVKSHSETIC